MSSELPLSAGGTRRVDETDRRLIGLLRADARRSVRDIASEANVSRANAYARLGRLAEDGVIRAYTVQTDHRAMGLSVSALVTLALDQQAWAEVRAALEAMDEVVWFAMTAGEFDVVALVRVATADHLRDLVLTRLQRHPGIRQTRTLFVLDEGGDPALG